MEPPNYSRIEIERHFLIVVVPGGLFDDIPATIIEDIYLDGGHLRLRKTSEPHSGRKVYKLGKKYRSEIPSARSVVSIYLDEAEYRSLALLPGRKLCKSRRRVTIGAHRLAIDVFQDRLSGLVLCEIEYGDEAEITGAAPFDWMGPEVTDNAFFDGWSLADADGASLARAIGQLVV